MFTFGQGYYGLVIDSGAAKQLTGSIPIKGYEKEILMPRGQLVNVIRKTENFCGISGKSIKSETEVTVPAPYHSRLPQINYVAPCLHNCATPPLMGKTMLKEEEFKLDCHKDFLLTPIPSIAEWHLAVKLDMVHEHLGITIVR